MTGSDWSLLGVILSLFGTVLATYGARLSSQETKARGDQLLAKTNELAAKSDELAAKSEENAKLSKELAAFATGGDSFFYLHFSRFGGDKPAAEVRHVGAYPVRNTELIFFDVTAQVPGIASGRARTFDLEGERKRQEIDIAYPGGPRRVLVRYPLETNTPAPTYSYFIHIGSGNGTYRQLVQFVNVGSVWKQGYRVDRVSQNEASENEFTLVAEYFDEDFPTDGEVLVKPSRQAN